MTTVISKTREQDEAKHKMKRIMDLAAARYKVEAAKVAADEGVATKS